MELVLIGLAIAAAYFLHGTSWFTLAVINAVASFWANGVLANFSPYESHLAPDWAALVSMVTCGLSLLFLALYFLFG